MMLNVIRLTSAAAMSALFALVFVVFQSPDALERSAVGFVKNEIETELIRLYPNLDPSLNIGRLQQFAARLGERQALISENIQNGFPLLIASEISRYCGCDEGETAQDVEIETVVRGMMEQQFQRLGIGQGQISEIIKGRYDIIVAALTRDVMIFLATNLVAFACIFGATFVPTKQRPLLVYPSLLLIGAVMVSSMLYLFNTNWFYAIIFQDYWGYGYSAMLLAIFGLLLDIIANRARVTLKLISNLPSLLVPVC